MLTVLPLPASRLRRALLWLALFAGVGCAQGVLIELLRGDTPDRQLLIFQLTGAVGAWASLPLVQVVVASARAPQGSLRTWLRFLSTHALGYLAFSLLHVAFIRMLRWALLQLSIVSVADGSLRVRLLWELQNDMVVYAGVAAVLTMLRAWRDRDDAAVRSHTLELRLAEAKLDALAARVDPHFFYNALNTISATMYEDLPRTERYLSHLGNLMRATLRSGDRTWSMREERAHTDRYVELMQARFGERLQVSWPIHEAVHERQLPRFAIQTLVENAIKHNARRRAPLQIAVEVRLAEEALIAVVADNGAGFSAPPAPGGSLARLDETLRLLHGEAAALVWGANPGGGARVEWRIPRSEA
jgi:two-component system LytT family sensor kinase